MNESMKKLIKKILHRLFKLSWLILPLKVRQLLSLWIGKISWLPGHSWLAMKMIRDLADADPNAYNRFMWANHIGFATDYEAANDFGPENLIATRVLLFDNMNEYLMENGVDEQTEVGSVFEVGCSSGFLLRHMENNVFPMATVFEGIDIDEQAIERGVSYLGQHGSKIQITCTDMASLDTLLEDKRFDLFLCAGVLRYLNQADASKVVSSMLHHAEKLVVIAGCAHPVVDNATLDSSVLDEDGTLIHNIDAMIEEAGGKVHFRRWEGAKSYKGYSVYFTFSSLAVLSDNCDRKEA